MAFPVPRCVWYDPEMEPIIRNVRDIEISVRRVLEHVLGRQLQENQQVIIQVATLENQSAEGNKGPSEVLPEKLPDWCNVYEGLTEAQIAEVEEVVLQRADLTRLPR